MELNEVMFRGKRLDGEGWAYGNLFVTPAGTTYIIRGTMMNFFIYEVFPDTVGRCIGTKDKNDKWIYEGDIVKTKFGRLCTVVCFLSPCNNCVDLTPIDTVENISHPAPSKYDLWKGFNLEVVGDIYDSKDGN